MNSARIDRMMAVRALLTVLLLLFAWGVRLQLEGLTGAIIGAVTTYWLPIPDPARRRKTDEGDQS